MRNGKQSLLLPVRESPSEGHSLLNTSKFRNARLPLNRPDLWTQRQSGFKGNELDSKADLNSLLPLNTRSEPGFKLQSDNLDSVTNRSQIHGCSPACSRETVSRIGPWVFLSAFKDQPKKGALKRRHTLTSELQASKNKSIKTLQKHTRAHAHTNTHTSPGDKPLVSPSSRRPGVGVLLGLQRRALLGRLPASASRLAGMRWDDPEQNPSPAAGGPLEERFASPWL